MWTRSEENDLVNWYDRGITWFLKRWGLLSLAEDHFWSTRYWRSTSSQHNRTVHRTVMETWVSTSEEEIIKSLNVSQTAFIHHVLHMETSTALLSSLPVLTTVLHPTECWIISLPNNAVVVLPEYIQKSACVLSDSEHQTGSFRALFQWNISSPCPKSKQGHWFSLSGFKTYKTKLMAGKKNKEKVVKQFIWKRQMVQIQFFQASPSGGWFRNETRSRVWNKKGEWSHPLSS